MHLPQTAWDAEKVPSLPHLASFSKGPSSDDANTHSPDSRSHSKNFLLFFLLSCCFASLLICIIIGGVYGRAFLNQPHANINPDTMIVQTEGGTVEGICESVVKFLGIPYGKPPVNELRWKPSVPADKWTGVRSAKQFGPICTQFSHSPLSPNATSSEDCLYLNIYAPNYIRLTDPTTLQLPVLFFIHGGSWQSGSGADYFYDGTSLTLKSQIVVTINYRLGPLGFLALQELLNEGNGTGNYGHYDMLLALNWVQKNIQNFGGNPNKVTIAGESAGATSVLALLGTSKSKGLFHQAISESGNTRLLASLKTGVNEGNIFVNGSKCANLTGALLLSCLRNLSLDELHIYDSCLSFYPIVDGVLFRNYSDKLMGTDEFQAVPLILGANKDEGTIFVANVTTLEDYTSNVSFYTLIAPLPVEAIPTLFDLYSLSKYASTDNPYFWSLSDIFGDYTWKCHSRTLAYKLKSQYPNLPVYLYEFSYLPSFQVWSSPVQSVYHFAEIPYLWNPPTMNFNSTEQKFINQFQDYWTSFIKTGNPNPPASAIKWPDYTRSSDLHIVFNKIITLDKSYGSLERCNFWEKYFDGYGYRGRCPSNYI